MSSTYAGADTYLESPLLPDDGDTPSAAGIGRPAFETAMDRTTWLRAQMKRPKLVALGAVPYMTNASRYATVFNYQSVTTATAAGDEYRATLVGLVHGAIIASIDVIFTPKTTARGGWPLGSAPVISLVRVAVGPSGGTPGAPSVVATATYAPVSQADYQDGKFKVMTVSPTHTVDAEAYVYQLSVVDESGANAIPGGTYFAYRVNYS